MKPPPFDYVRAHDFGEALECLSNAGEEAKLLAGGQSLVPMLNLRLARPSILVDINRIGLDRIYVEEDEIHIEALTRHATLEHDPLIAKEAPLLSLAARLIGHEAIRTRGTVGGSMAHADPAAELIATAVALGARVEVQSAREERLIKASDLAVGPFTTSLSYDEMITKVVFPRHGEFGCAVEEITTRAGDFALVGVAACVRRDSDDRVEEAGISAFGVGGVPVRASRAESSLLGNHLTPEALKEASRVASAEVNPHDDVHATGTYRRAMVRVLTSRALVKAAERFHGT